MIGMNKPGLLHRIPLVVLTAIAIWAALTIAARARAQTIESPWQQPTNVSQSGATSQSRSAVTSDGTLHMIWWDSEKGEQYSYTTNISGTTWARPITMPDVYNRRDQDTQTGKVILSQPSDVRLAATTKGDLYVFWSNIFGELLSARARGGDWGQSDRIAESASKINVAADPAGGLHLAFARPADTTELPAGIYYSGNRDGSWSSPTLVYASPYFRALKPEDAHLSVAGLDTGQIVVAWDDPQLGQSVYARSTDGGVTWSGPQVVAGSAGPSKQARVATTPAGELLMIWQDTGSGGCGYVQRRSSDGGATWTAPEKTLSTLTQCDLDWTFTPTADRLWLVGRPRPQDENTINEVTMAVWDGSQWSDPIAASLTFLDKATDRTVSLNCLNVSVNDEAAGIFGCDPAKDLWAAHNNMPLNQIIPQLQPVWSPLTPLSDRSVPAAADDLPVLAQNDQGAFFALWSQAIADNDSASALYATTGDNGHWARTVRVLNSPESRTGQAGIAVQPAVTIDAQNKAHAVWSSGTNGRIFYSWAFARDFNNAAAWAEPIALPSPGGLLSWPDIVADPRGNQLYATYAVPLNERRGVYLVRSLDSGTTWISPTTIFDAVAANWDSIDKPRIALDPAGDTLHVVWLRQLPPGGAGQQAVYYARSKDRGETWISPTLIAQGHVDWPRIAVGGPDQIYIAWNEDVQPRQPGSATPMTVWGQFSADGGEHWTSPSNIRSLQEVSGPVGLAGDGSGHLYMAAVSKANGGESRLVNVKWNGHDWDERPALGLQQVAAAGNSAVVAIASNQGEQAVLLRHQVWNSDNTTQLVIDATQRQVTAQALTPVPTFTPQPAPALQITATLQPTPTPRPKLNENAYQPTSGGGMSPLVLAAVFAALVVAVAVGRTIWVRRG